MEEQLTPEQIGWSDAVLLAATYNMRFPASQIGGEEGVGETDSFWINSRQ
jgi:hypothetical protein